MQKLEVSYVVANKSIQFQAPTEEEHDPIVEVLASPTSQLVPIRAFVDTLEEDLLYALGSSICCYQLAPLLVDSMAIFQFSFFPSILSYLYSCFIVVLRNEWFINFFQKQNLN